jgi:hypothetical protein
LATFLAGWPTLGLTWFIAAVSLAPPDSWRARSSTAGTATRVSSTDAESDARVTGCITIVDHVLG